MSARSSLRQNALFILTILAVISGIGLGMFARDYSIKKESLIYRLIYFPGEIFLRGIKFLIVPLITSSLIVGIAGNTVVKTGGIARKTMLYFFITTLLSVLVGVAVVMSIKPGQIKSPTDTNSTDIKKSDALPNVPSLNAADSFMDLVRNLIPDNLIEMCFQTYRSKIQPKTSRDVGNSSTQSFTVVGSFNRGVNILGLALFSCTFGAVLASLGESGRPMLQFFDIFNQISLKMIRILMWYSPIGVCSLVCVSIIQVEDMSTIFTKTLMYVVTFCLGMAIHGVLILPGLFLILTRANVLKFTKDMIQVLLMAFATSSSSATLPTSIQCIEENAKYPKAVSRVVLPCGIIVNKDGTALYYVVTTNFIAFLNNINLSVVEIVISATVALLISAGGSGTPGGHLVNGIILLQILGIPVEQISLLYAIDWMIDRILTVINCWSDCIVCGIVYHLSKKELESDQGEIEDEVLMKDLSQVRL